MDGKKTDGVQSASVPQRSDSVPDKSSVVETTKPSVEISTAPHGPSATDAATWQITARPATATPHAGHDEFVVQPERGDQRGATGLGLAKDSQQPLTLGVLLLMCVAILAFSRGVEFNANHRHMLWGRPIDYQYRSAIGAAQALGCFFSIVLAIKLASISRAGCFWYFLLFVLWAESIYAVYGLAYIGGERFGSTFKVVYPVINNIGATPVGPPNRP